MALGYARFALPLLLLTLVAACGGRTPPGTWPLPASDLGGTRAAVGSTITAANVQQLRVRFRFRAPADLSGNFASPVADAGTVYVEDSRSNVFALDRSTGKLQWAHHYNTPSNESSGLAVDGGRLYGANDKGVFALAAANGRELWGRHLTSASELVDAAPVPWQGLLFVGTSGGAVYALDAATGRVRWRAHSGGGSRYPVSVDDQARLYAAAGTGSLIVLDAKTGALLWQDLRDTGLGASPVLADGLVVGAGNGGRVIAWRQATHSRVWETAIGTGPLCPRPLRAVETAPAYAKGRVFAPVTDLCATAQRAGTGRLVALTAASGRVVWQRRLARPDYGCATVANDVVFTSSHDGGVYAFATRTGAPLWHTRTHTTIDSCASVTGDTLIVGAAAGKAPELIAYALPRNG